MSEAEAISKQIGTLTADQRADQLQRLERSLLRLERINVQTLALLQKLVHAVKRNHGLVMIRPVP
jgi:general secretion pathway protein A